MIEDAQTIRDVDNCFQELAAQGFGARASVGSAGTVACGVCGHVASARDVEILAVRRLEGVSDPSEEKIVLGLRCKQCRHKSALALTYGPSVSGADGEILQLLDITVWRAPNM